MPGKLPPKHAGDQAKEHVAQYVSARLVAECEERGAATRIAKATGFTPAAIANAKNHARVGADLARGLAKYWHMTIDQLEAVAMGKEDPAPGLPADSPSPPPAESDVRTKTVADHWFPDEVEDLFIAAVRRRADVNYSAPVARVAKVFVRDATHQLKAGVTRLDLMLSALDTARELETSGAELTTDAIYGAMISQAIERAVPRQDSTLARVLREADEKNQREGVVANVSAQAPRALVDDRLKAHQVELPPMPPPPPPASGPVRKKGRGR